MKTLLKLFTLITLVSGSVMAMGGGNEAEAPEDEKSAAGGAHQQLPVEYQLRPIDDLQPSSTSHKKLKISSFRPKVQIKDPWRPGHFLWF